MKQAIILAIIIGGLIVAGWAFFAFGGQTVGTLSQSQQEVLSTKDKRLTKGDPDAPIKIVEYADVLCPFCAKNFVKTWPKLKRDFIDTGKVYYEMRLVGVISPDSGRAARGAYCAAEQGAFWDYMHKAYTTTWNNYYSKGMKPSAVDLFSSDKIGEFVDGLGLNQQQWQRCLDSGKYAGTIAQNQSRMRKMGARGTPYFIIGGHGYSGAPPYNIIKKTIEAELNRAQQDGQGTN